MTFFGTARFVRDVLLASGYRVIRVGHVSWEEPTTQPLQKTMSTPTLQCDIENLSECYPNLFLEPHVVACVAIMSKYGAPQAALEVKCDNIESPRWPQLADLRLELLWRPETELQATRLLATLQRKPLVELASCALAMLLVYHLLDEAALDVTQYGDRADYRFLDRPCVLEVSGTENPAQIDRRVREKAAQALDNPMQRDAFVVVSAFSESGHQIRFSFHRRKSSDA